MDQIPSYVDQIIASIAGAAALEEAQQKNPHMCSLHNVHCLGISVGDNIVPDYSGATVNDNPYYHLIPWSERRGLR